jgi:hypothetical protein
MQKKPVTSGRDIKVIKAREIVYEGTWILIKAPLKQIARIVSVATPAKKP